MKLLQSLTNRIFFGSALLAVSAISIAIFNVNRGAQAPRGAALLRGLLDDAGLPATGAAEPEPATLF